MYMYTFVIKAFFLSMSCSLPFYCYFPLYAYIYIRREHCRRNVVWWWHGLPELLGVKGNMWKNTRLYSPNLYTYLCLHPPTKIVKCSVKPIRRYIAQKPYNRENALSTKKESLFLWINENRRANQERIKSCHYIKLYKRKDCLTEFLLPNEDWNIPTRTSV